MHASKEDSRSLLLLQNLQLPVFRKVLFGSEVSSRRLLYAGWYALEGRCWCKMSEINELFLLQVEVDSRN